MSNPVAAPRTFADSVAAYALAGWPCITLPTGQQVLVDPGDLAAVSRHTWGVTQENYVRATIDGERVFLHRWLTGAGAGQVVDHVNGDPLDNRRSNLRVCTTAQNLANKKRPSTNTSGYKGVVWRPSRGKWEAAIQPRSGYRFLGRFDDPWEAAQAYNAAAIELYGEFARLNERIEVSA